MITAPPISIAAPHASQMRLSSAIPARSPGSSFATMVGEGSGALPGFVIMGWARGSEPISFGLTIVGAGKKPDTVGVGKISVGAAAGGSGVGEGSGVAKGSAVTVNWGATTVGPAVFVGSRVHVGAAGIVGEGVIGVGRMGEDWNVVRALTPQDSMSVRMAAAARTTMNGRTV